MSRGGSGPLRLVSHHLSGRQPARSVSALPWKLSNRVVCAGLHAVSVYIAPDWVIGIRQPGSTRMPSKTSRAAPVTAGALPG